MVARFHYEDAIFERLLQDKLRPQEQQDITRHIESCTECQSKLETLAENGVDWNELRDYLKPSETATSHGQSKNKNSIWVGFLQPSDHPDSLGRFGRYEILEILGRGGTGIVMRGYDPSLDRQSAIKVLSPELAASAAARQRFSREAKSAAAVVHEHVVPIQTVDQEQGLPYLVMPVLEGRSLEDRIRNNGPLEVKEVLRIGRQIASGLAAAHHQGLVHRDVKPANILLHNGVERVVITDFGLARTVDDASMTQSGTLVGTPQYMSPEQARGESLDARSDLFSLGSVLYSMLVGHSPFRAETTMGVLNRITGDQPRRLTEQNPEIPLWLDQIIRRLLSKRPEDRYQTAAEVESLLGQWLAHLQDPTGTPRPSEPPPTETGGGSRRRKLILAVIGGFALLLAGIFVVLETNKGTLTIQSDADDIAVRITQGDQVARQLTVVQGNNQVRLAAGKYVVEIEGAHDGLTIENGQVTLTRGDQQLVRIVEQAASVPADEKIFRDTGVGRDGNQIGVPVGSPPSAKNAQLSPELTQLQGEWKIPEASIDRIGLTDETGATIWVDRAVFTGDKARIDFRFKKMFQGELVSESTPVPFRVELEPSATGEPSKIIFLGDGVRPQIGTIRATYQLNGDLLTFTITEKKDPEHAVGPEPVTWELRRKPAGKTPANASNSNPGERIYRTQDGLPAPIRGLQGTWTATSQIGDQLKDLIDPLASVRFKFEGMSVRMQVVDGQQQVLHEHLGRIRDEGYVEFRFPDQPKLKASFQATGYELTMRVASDDGDKFYSADLPATWQFQKGVLVHDPADGGKIVIAEPSFDLGTYQVFYRKRDNLYFTYAKNTNSWHRYQFPKGLKIKMYKGDWRPPAGERGSIAFEISGSSIRELVGIDAHGSFRPYLLDQPIEHDVYGIQPGQGLLCYVANQHIYAFSAVTGTWDELSVPNLSPLVKDGTGVWQLPAGETRFHPDAPEGIEVTFNDYRMVFSPQRGSWVRKPISDAPEDLELQKTIGERIRKQINDNGPIPEALAKLKGRWYATSQSRGGQEDEPASRKAYLTELFLGMRTSMLFWQTEIAAPDRSFIHRPSINPNVDVEEGADNEPNRITFHLSSRTGQPQTLLGTYEQNGDDLTITITKAINPPPELGPLPVTWKLRRAPTKRNADGRIADPPWLDELSRTYPPRLDSKPKPPTANSASEESSKPAETMPEENSAMNRAYAQRVAKIQQQLHSETKIQFVRTPLALVIGYLEKLHGISIVFDHQALEVAGISETAEVNCDVADITLAEGLPRLLGPLKLRHVIRDGDLVITTQSDVKPKYSRTGPVSSELQAMQGHWQTDDWRLIVIFNRFEFIRMKRNGEHIAGRIILNPSGNKVILEEEGFDPQADPFGPRNQKRLFSATIDFTELAKGRLNLTGIDIPSDSSLAGEVAGQWSFIKTKPAADPFADPKQQPTIELKGSSRNLPDGTMMFRVRLFNNGSVTLQSVKVEAKVDSNLEVIARTDPAKDIEGGILWLLPRILPQQEAFFEVACKPQDGASEGTNEIIVTADGGFEQKITMRGDKNRSEPEVDSSSVSRAGSSRSNSRRRIAPPEILLPELTPLQGVWQSEDWTLKVQFDGYWLQATGKQAGRIITGTVSRNAKDNKITFDEEVAVGNTMDPFGPTERKRVFMANCDAHELAAGRLQLTNIETPEGSTLAGKMAKTCTFVKGDDVRSPFIDVPAQPLSFDLQGSAKSEPDGTLRFVIRVNNDGYSALKNMSVKVAIDPKLQVVSRTDPAKDDDHSVVWSLPLVLRHQEAILEVVCRPQDGATEGTCEVTVNAEGGIERSIKIQGERDQAIPLNPELMKLQGHWQADGWMLIITHDRFRLSKVVDRREAKRFSGSIVLDSAKNKVDFVEPLSEPEQYQSMVQATINQDALKEGRLELTLISIPMDSPLLGEIQGTWAFERAKQVAEKPNQRVEESPVFDLKTSAHRNPQGNIIYRVWFRNTGTSSLDNVTIKELIDPQLRMVARTDPAEDVKGGVAWKYPTMHPGQETSLEMECQPQAEITSATNRVTITADGGFELTHRVKFQEEAEKGKSEPNQNPFSGFSVPSNSMRLSPEKEFQNRLQGIWKIAKNERSHPQASGQAAIFHPQELLVNRRLFLLSNAEIRAEVVTDLPDRKFLQGVWKLVPDKKDPHSMQGTFEWICTDQPYGIRENPAAPLENEAMVVVTPNQLIKRKRTLRGTYQLAGDQLMLNVTEAEDPPEFLGELPLQWTFQGPPVAPPSHDEPTVY